MNFGANVMLAAKTDECSIYKMENESGEGIMTCYEVLPGIRVMYNDFHMEYVESRLELYGSDILCIDHCREGRIETVTNDNHAKELWANCLSVDVRIHHQGISRFPTSHFHGMTICLELPKAQESLGKQFRGFCVSLADLQKKYCADGTPCVLEANEGIKAVFHQMYRLPAPIQIIYLRVKIIELLLYLGTLSLADQKLQKPYFYKTDIEKVHAISRHILKEPATHYTISRLSEIYGISESALKKCFKSEFGMPVYTYLQSVRIQASAALLIRQGKMNIADIAAMVGYESPGKFTAVFKKIKGVTPSEYRKHPLSRPIGLPAETTKD